MARRKPQLTSPATKANWGKPEDIMKVKGIQTFTILNGRLAESKKGCQQKIEAKAPNGF